MEAKNYFSGIASQYQAHRPDYSNELFQYLGMLCDEHELAWDVGTGSGQAATQLAEQFDKVYASDQSQEQIARAKLKPNIEYKQEDAELCSLADNSVDMVCAAQSLHWFELDEFFKQVDRVLKPSGIFAVWCYPLLSVNPQVDEVIKNLYENILKGYWSPRRQLVTEGYQQIELPYPTIPAPTFKMEQTWSYQHLLSYLETWTATQKYIADNGVSPLDSILKPLEFAWCDTQHLKLVNWQLLLKICRKP